MRGNGKSYICKTHYKPININLWLKENCIQTVSKVNVWQLFLQRFFSFPLEEYRQVKSRLKEFWKYAIYSQMTPSIAKPSDCKSLKPIQHNVSPILTTHSIACVRIIYKPLLYNICNVHYYNFNCKVWVLIRSNQSLFIRENLQN